MLLRPKSFLRKQALSMQRSLFSRLLFKWLCHVPYLLYTQSSDATFLATVQFGYVEISSQGAKLVRNLQKNPKPQYQKEQETCGDEYQRFQSICPPRKIHLQRDMQYMNFVWLKNCICYANLLRLLQYIRDGNLGCSSPSPAAICSLIRSKKSVTSEMDLTGIRTGALNLP